MHGPLDPGAKTKVCSRQGCEESRNVGKFTEETLKRYTAALKSDTSVKYANNKGQQKPEQGENVFKQLAHTNVTRSRTTGGKIFKRRK